MGWNEGYRIMERQVVALYDLNVLSKDVLNAVMEPFKNTDIDSGGSEDLKAIDGLGVENIVCKVVKPQEYERILETTEACRDADGECKSCGGEGRDCLLFDLWSDIKKNEWRFW